MQAPAPIAIDPDLRPDAMAAVFRRLGRLHIPGFLTEPSARALHDRLAVETLWVCSTIGGGTVADVPVEMLEALSPAERARFEALAHREARDGFHYMFDSLRITDAIDRGEPLEPLYRSAVDFLNSEPFLAFVRALTADQRPAYVDAQATRFLPGHYLTRHDDQKPSAGRLYAYVLNLTPVWRADWGGLLNFLDEDGHVAEGYTPSWNALNIFRVPQAHAVSYVAPFAGASRLSITGWIRDDPPPASPFKQT
jgi:SM-20-related protein